MTSPQAHLRGLVQVELRVWLWWALVLISVIRLLAAVHSGLTYTRGDFYATLPGAHVRELNPSLWNSPDLERSSGFHRNVYLYGPTQFLTLYPLAWFDSYAGIARALLVVYGALLVAAGWVITAALRRLSIGITTRAAVIAGTALYLPLLQAYVQREFETVVVVVMTMALFAVASGRTWVAGAAIGYITWFKFFPIVFLPYFIARGWWRAAAAFVTSSVVVLAVSHLVFDLRRFAPVIDLVNVSAQSALSVTQTCSAWLAESNDTLASVRYGLCRLGGPADFAVLDGVFWMTVGLALLVFGRTFLLARHVVLKDSADERMRGMLEFSFLLTFAAGVFYAHYYYLAQLVIPINVLVYRYATHHEQRGLKITVLGAVYLLLTAFVVPTSVTSAVFGVDAWRLYMQHAFYMYGQTLLIALLLWEYYALVRQARRKVVAASRVVGSEAVAQGLTQAFAKPWL